MRIAEPAVLSHLYTVKLAEIVRIQLKKISNHRLLVERRGNHFDV